MPLKSKGKAKAKGKGKGGAGPVIADPNCSNGGRCIDVCGQSVFHFTHRFDTRRD